MADDSRSLIRRSFLRMVLLIVAIAAVALALRHLLRLERATIRTQMMFTAAWMVANLIVVIGGLARIRAARLVARRGRAR